MWLTIAHKTPSLPEQELDDKLEFDRSRPWHFYFFAFLELPGASQMHWARLPRQEVTTS
jgi:hypothetical protein